MIYNFGIIQIFIRDFYSALNLSQTLTENPVDITVRLIWKIQNCSYIHPIFIQKNVLFTDLKSL